ncbi:hypothetical protein M8756_12875 [Lutimaribacter sp. EGI FJ00015]|uniref:Uncharacterized protein n=1 Tax=Lutimaribacter degradans TaxID=2945989 RepID=A0ACC5ZZV6_9RHOB|nr:hypothetical protein [Lutimaribacter sp. EGI FJ00013]MCM2563876.1 hypothetical protein [Lutimaribacter sp. EGI FJ00013]MCO0614204.1 hypothetical protein [Lutimaribacter sp. EGI FJ00015]MCO0636181.1 hypothetical protein [Lutimaribacter sp. EGI FJ00014]
MDAAQFEGLAERITRGLLDGDFDVYASAFRLPLRVVPRNGQSYVLADRASLRDDWALYRDAITIQGVTDIIRGLVAFEVIEPDWIEVLVTTDMLRGAQRVVDPFKTQFVLQPAGDEWRITIIRSSLGHINWTLGRADIVDNRFRPRDPDQEDQDK